MFQTITATFENGVLRPAQPLDLPRDAQVRLTIELLDADAQTDQRLSALSALESLWRRSAIDSRGERLSRDQLHERR